MIYTVTTSNGLGGNPKRFNTLKEAKRYLEYLDKKQRGKQRITIEKNNKVIYRTF